MKKFNMKKHLITGGLTAVLAAGLVVPSSAFAASNNSTYTTTPVSYWKTFYYTIPWNQFYTQQPVQNGGQNTQQPAQTDSQKTQQPAQNGNQNTQQPATQPSPSNTGTAGNTAGDKSTFATQVITLVNQERAKQGLKPLKGDAQLNNMALAKAKDMSQNNYFDHTSPTYGSPFDMMKKFGISYSYAGENIAMGQKTPEEVVKAWMNSSGHRANIMNANYTLIGVGYYNGYWAQEFVGR